MYQELREISNAYRRYASLNKEAGYWSNVAGGAHELFVRPFRSGYRAVRDSISSWFKDTKNDAQSWYERNIWDKDPNKYGKLERFLAGDDYYKSIERGPLSAHTPRNAQDQHNFNKRAILDGDYIIDADTGKRSTLAEIRARNRHRHQASILQSKIYDLQTKMTAAGYTPSAIASHVRQLEENYWRKQRAARPKFNVD